MESDSGSESDGTIYKKIEASPKTSAQRVKKGKERKLTSEEKNGIYIIINVDEHKVIPYFFTSIIERYKIPFEVTKFCHGDYAIMYRGEIILIIERKTLADLSATLSDSRSKNKDKMIEFARENNVRVCYLIEGNPFSSPNKKYGGKRFRDLISHLDHASLRDKMPIYWSKDKTTTPARIMELAKNIGTIKPSPFEEIDKKLDEIQGGSDGKKSGHELIKIRAPKQDLDIIYKMWCAIPYITDKTASLLIDAKYTVRQFVTNKLKKTDISCLRYPSGTLVGSRVEKMFHVTSRESIRARKVHVNILASVPLISKKSAEIILDQICMHDLLELDKSPDFVKLDAEERVKNITDYIAVLNKGKVKVGRAAATNIYKYLLSWVP